MSSNETKTYALETFHNLGRWLRTRWLRLRQPGLAMLADQMMSTGVFFNSTVIPPNAGAAPAIKWLKNGWLTLIDQQCNSVSSDMYQQA